MVDKEWYEGIYALQKAVTVVLATVLKKEELARRIWEGILKYEEHSYSYWSVGIVVFSDG